MGRYRKRRRAVLSEGPLIPTSKAQGFRMFGLPKRFSSQGITWEQLAFQFLIVLIGVYLAISFERRAEDRSRQEEASEMLGRILDEIRLDEADINLVITEGRIGSAAVDSLLVLLEEDPTANGSRIDSIINGPLAVTRTVFPRQAAYTALVSGGYLTSLADQGLAIRLANLYEHAYGRILANNAFSDRVAHDIYLVFLNYWDPGRHQFITPRSEENIRALNAWRYLKENFYDWYAAELAPSILEEVSAVRMELETYLGR